MVRAVVLPAVGAPMTVEDIDLPEPGPGQVRVRLAAAGVCHSDLSLSNGTLRQPVPAVLGHEGAGTVVSVGDGVTRVRPGDAVVLNWSPSCGTCRFCAGGEPYLCVHSGDAAARAVRDAGRRRAAVRGPRHGRVRRGDGRAGGAACCRCPTAYRSTVAALLGCAVLTGFGAVTHAAGVRAGRIGRRVRARRRRPGHVAVGPDRRRRDDHRGRRTRRRRKSWPGPRARPTSCWPTTRPRRPIRGLTGGFGADHAFECVGRAATIRTAWSSTRRGGSTTVVGIGSAADKVEFSALELFHFARTLRGCVYGNGDPAVDLPVLADHVRAGRLDLDALITDRITLDDVPSALDRMARGEGARSLVVF